MNCQTFESHIDELARERMMEAATREAATAHAGSCRRCSARLADERALTAGLRALSSADARSHEAPRRVETALMAAFRAQQQQPQTSAPVAAPISSHTAGTATLFASRRARARWFAHAWVQGTAVAAAAMLIVFGFSAMRGRLARPGGQREQAAAVLSPPNAAATAAPVASSNVAPALEPAAEVAQSPEEDAELNSIEQIEDAASSHSDNATRPAQTRAVRYSNAGYRTGAAASSSASNAGRTTTAVAEITTDFIPLAHGGALAPEEGGQVMRVELPRSALVSFGLPMNVERAGERVKADVLIGEDGVARAIRFVR
ncbi:MAG TPA: hypothetical protein VGW12_18955 [Pyrinomonadaceae bacterium]|nr:hypothetical protein [Pyrinomonadaceae bacterium]